MGLFKKDEPKITPAQLKTKLVLNQKKLEKREAGLRKKEDSHRNNAKEALKKGDERTFNREARRYSLLNSQAKTVANMVDTTTAILDLVEMQQNVNEIVAIGNDLNELQEVLGIDASEIEKAVTNIRTSMEQVNMSSEMLSTTMETISENPESTDLQDELKAELMAELSEEEEGDKDLEKKLEAQGV